MNVRSACSRFAVFYWTLIALTIVPSILSWRLAWKYRSIGRRPGSVQRFIPIPHDKAIAIVGGTLIEVAIPGGEVRDITTCHDQSIATASTAGVTLFSSSGALLRNLSIGKATAIACGPAGTLFVGLEDGRLMSVAPGAVKSLSAPGAIAGLAFHRKTILATLEVNNELVEIDPISGIITSRRQLTGHAGGLKISNGSVLMSDRQTGRVWVIDPASEELLVTSRFDERVAGNARLLAVSHSRLFIRGDEGVSIVEMETVH